MCSKSSIIVLSTFVFTIVATLLYSTYSHASDEAPQAANLDQALIAERQSLERNYSITPHRPNYILPFTHNSNPNQFEGIDEADGASVDYSEAEFQVSMKFPLVQGIFNSNTDILVAFTSHSWWQVYNSDSSAPFRETNYEPEIFIRQYDGAEIFGIKANFWDLGLVHESNGRSELFSPISRSWNRLYGTAVFGYGDLTLALKAWYRIPEDEEDDDNPDIHHYRGYGHIRAIYNPNKHTFSAMYRPGTKEGGFEFSWSYPISNHLRIYTKLYSGYGESLLDYDHRVERIGIGIAINDFL